MVEEENVDEKMLALRNQKELKGLEKQYRRIRARDRLDPELRP